MATSQPVREQLITALQQAFNNQPGPVAHAMSVLDYAEQMRSAGEPGDELTVVASAILHDIGAAEAMRKHGRSSHDLQELEGPPVARAIMESLAIDRDVVDHVCQIIGTHHTGALDTPEFRILWDADWLVNLAGAAATTPPEELNQRIDQTFRTHTGRKIAHRIFLES